MKATDEEIRRSVITSSAVEGIKTNLLPFKMRTETKMEKYRHDTFWTKEPECLAWIKSFSPHDIFFDIGANVGVYSLFASSLYPEMTIWAFEPMQANYAALVKNIEMNRYHNIKAYRQAIGNRTGWVDLDRGDGACGESGAQVTNRQGRTWIASIDKLRPTRPDQVKIDIDGQELEVVKGMKRTLPHIKSCLIEVSEASKGAIMCIMTTAGFTTDNRFNSMTPHSSDRRAAEGIDAENIVFTR